MSKNQLDIILANTLYEAPEEESEEAPEKESEKEKTEIETEKEVDGKEIKDVDKEDLEDDEKDLDSEEVVVAIKFNDNIKRGGSIKLISYKSLGSLNSIESILEIFNIDPNNVAPEFKNRVEITINSPISDFKDQEYKILLMDKTGEIKIDRQNYKTNIEKHSSTSMDQAVQQQVGEPGVSQSPATPKESGIDLSYLPELNKVFRSTIKNEFFDKILEKY